MKLQQATKGATVSGQRHQKASDVHAEANYLFGEKKSVGEAFPDIVGIGIAVTRSGKHRNNQWEKVLLRYDLSNFPGEYIDCGNPLCYNGGFSIGRVIATMYRERNTAFEGHAFCQGHEGSPKGRRNDGPCSTGFRYSITVIYSQSGNASNDTGETLDGAPDNPQSSRE